MEEVEITVLVMTSYDKLNKELIDNGFSIKEKYELNDTYMIDSNINLKNLSNLEILQKCILVRDIVDIKKLLLYKEKVYDKGNYLVKKAEITLKEVLEV